MKMHSGQHTHTHAGDLCPRTIFLGINNTMKEEHDTICQVAIFSPLWVDNRTGFDLIFRDLDVPSAFNDLPFLSECSRACVHA